MSGMGGDFDNALADAYSSVSMKCHIHWYIMKVVQLSFHFAKDVGGKVFFDGTIYIFYGRLLAQ